MPGPHGPGIVALDVHVTITHHADMPIHADLIHTTTDDALVRAMSTGEITLYGATDTLSRHTGTVPSRQAAVAAVTRLVRAGLVAKDDTCGSMLYSLTATGRARARVIASWDRIVPPDTVTDEPAPVAPVRAPAPVEPVAEQCTRTLSGAACSRMPGHDGPCTFDLAAVAPAPVELTAAVADHDAVAAVDAVPAIPAHTMARHAADRAATVAAQADRSARLAAEHGYTYGPCVCGWSGAPMGARCERCTGTVEPAPTVDRVPTPRHGGSVWMSAAVARVRRSGRMRVSTAAVLTLMTLFVIGALAHPDRAGAMVRVPTCRIVVGSVDDVTAAHPGTRDPLSHADYTPATRTYGTWTVHGHPSRVIGYAAAEDSIVWNTPTCAIHRDPYTGAPR